MRVVGLLPVKHHSERVPGKNFRDFRGRPLYAHVLGMLLSSGVVDEVVINTDSEVLLGNSALADNARVVLRRRRESLRGDFVDMNRVLEDDVLVVDADVYVMTHVTNPLLTAETVVAALREFDGCGDCDSLFSVTKHQGRFFDSSGAPVNHDPDELLRTQDLEPLFEENSCLYVFTRESFKRVGRRIGLKPKRFVTPRIESVDIDTEEDWLVAEALAGVHVRGRGEGVA